MKVIKLTVKEKQFISQRSNYTYQILRNMGLIKYGHENDIIESEDRFYRLYNSINPEQEGSVDLTTENSVYCTKKFKEAIKKLERLTDCDIDITLTCKKSFINAKLVFSSKVPGICGVGQLPLTISKADYMSCQ